MWLRSVGVGGVEIDFPYAITGVYAKFFNGRKIRLISSIGGLGTSQIRTVTFLGIYKYFFLQNAREKVHTLDKVCNENRPYLTNWARCH